MRKWLAALALAGALVGFGHEYVEEVVHAATCTGSSPCNACKNCSSCKHCAKNGGSCGICKLNRK